MKNTLQNDLFLDDFDGIVDLKTTAESLEISTATVRNWVKCGYLKTIRKEGRPVFSEKDVDDIKLKILNGDLEKLNKRANKKKSTKTFTPDEYVYDKNKLNQLNLIISFIKKNNIDESLSIFLIAVNLLKKNGLLHDVSIEDVFKRKDLLSTNKQIEKELKSWLFKIDVKQINNSFHFLLDCDISNQNDILGVLYQSILSEGAKSNKGSYYTPSGIVDDIANNYIEENSKVFDPCCGTGQFLLTFANFVKNPLNIYGIDSDELAVRIARINILIKFKNIDFNPNIFCKNALIKFDSSDLFSHKKNKLDADFELALKDFDLIATNPPWGVHFSIDEMRELKKEYPVIESAESFSLFLIRSLDLLREGGIISFILPESFLNVKTHSDIRKILLKNHTIKKIIHLGRVFKNVFTSAIRIDVENNKSIDNKIYVQMGGENYYINQNSFLSNKDCVFNIDANEVDRKILEKILKKGKITLKGNAEWGLGIVTGNNKKHITSIKDGKNERIITGKDIKKFKISPSSLYLTFDQNNFQQVAPESKYREKEKIVYRFISRKLVFAMDVEQRLTLNSANFFIPSISEIPNKVLMALLNSSIFQFFFQKKFNSIKILRSHLEQIIFPIFTKEENNNIINFVDKIIAGGDYFDQLDSYLLNKFDLTDYEITHIKNNTF